MKVRIIQPRYSFESVDIEKCFEGQLSLMRECSEPLDVIVMPEYCDIPAAQKGKEGYHSAIKRYNSIVLDEAREMARRCSANVFINCADPYGDTYRNTTHVIDRKGDTVGKYFKAHPAPKEDKSEAIGGLEMDSSYSTPGALPYTVTLEGVKYGFMTCYDFYMYEEFARLARENVDIIIGCSHQRTDKHSALEIINRFLSYNTNSYLIRSSVSLGEDSPIGGCSCVIAPSGDVIADMKSRAGYETVEIDPSAKYYKAAGFGGVGKAPKPHYEYIEDGRRPWLYRNGGASVVRPDSLMPYPRLCAHRGFNTVAPENSLAAFGAAVALGADEIEFDVWKTKDGVLVSSHDKTLERVSDGNGDIRDYTYGELCELDFGYKYSDKFKGLKIPTVEEILQKFAARCIMNVHVKVWDTKMDEDCLDKLAELFHKYDCESYCYFMSRNDKMLALSMKKYPKIGVCVGAGNTPYQIVDRAIAIGAKKVQLIKNKYTPEMVAKAKEHGIIMNLFDSDDPTEAIELIDSGIDCVLTNDFFSVKSAFDNKFGNG